ncbi:MAG: hypothetical protein ACJAVV_002481 [Alphaproteobacteria bacterium]|jgi:uncharacterized protein YcgL (UPF0745 family)
MKLSAVYKSPRKADTFLYVEKRDDFAAVPEGLMKQFGVPIFVMLIPLSKRETVAGINRDKLVERIQAEGFYLQLPPKPKNLLDAHLESQQINMKNEAN